MVKKKKNEKLIDWENPNVDWRSLDVMTTFYVNSKVNQVLKDLAEEKGTSRSALIRELMIDYIKNIERERKEG